MENDTKFFLFLYALLLGTFVWQPLSYVFVVLWALWGLKIATKLMERH